MKKFTLLFCLFVACNSFHAATATAQNAADYTFSSNSSISLEDISTGAITLIGSGVDDNTSAVTNLPFTFGFAGINYTAFSVSSNGLLGFGSTPVDVNYWDYALIEALTYPIVSPWSDDLSTAANGGVRYKSVLQSNGLRKLVIEWNVKAFTDRTAELFNKTFQVWLFEGSNKLQIVYGNASEYRFNNATIGIAASNADYIAVNAIEHTASNTDAAIINNEWPGAGMSYIFNPSATTTPEPITVNANSAVTNVNCNATNNGSIALGTISGGNGNYTITWTGPNGYTGTGSTIGNLYAGTYNYTVTDNVSASANGTLTVTEPEILQASVAGLSNVKCNGGTDGSFTITANGGTSDYTYEISGVSNQNGIFNGLAAGTYVVVIKDSKGCTITKEVIITQPLVQVAEIVTSGSTAICQGSSVNLTASTGASYLWSNGATTQSIAVNTAGEYSVAVTNANGCAATSAPLSTTVAPLPVATIAVGSDKSLLCSGLALNAGSSTAVSSYAWSNGSTLASIALTNNDADGLYTVKVIDANGCTSAPAAYTFNKQHLLGSYTVVGLASVNFGNGTTVSKGSVGVTGSTGTVTLGSNSSVAAPGAVVKAKSITIGSAANAPNVVYAPATLTLPAMQYNTSSASAYATYTASGSNITLTANYKTLLVKAGSSVTLTGNIFGTVTIESGATVTFTSATVNIDKLIVSSTKATITTPLALVKFAEESAVRFSTSAAIYGRSRINEEHNDVTFYCGDNNNDAETFTVSGLDTRVSGTIYIPVGTLSVTATDASTKTTMNGLFIAQQVKSTGAKAVWQSQGCNNATPSFSMNNLNLSAEMFPVTGASKIKVFPSLTSGPFTVQLNKITGLKTVVFVLDNTGSIVAQQDVTNGEQLIRFNLANKPTGMYFVKVISETGIQTERIMVQR